ncbi:MAG: RNA-binding protein [Actinobacteria bacterium]|nr:RNA-binding protein [Actinomycetota bacterium]
MQGSKLYVGNLTYSVTDEQLTNLFSSYGEVKQVTLIGNKGFGFIEMSNSEEAQKAKEALDGTNFEGRNIKVDEARPQKERPSNRGYRRY